MGKLSEAFSSWDKPTSFASEGNSMYTFLGETSGPISVDLSTKSAAEATKSENTAKSKTGSNDDITSRLEALEAQRKNEFSGISRT
jgi:hypothetical protein